MTPASGHSRAEWALLHLGFIFTGIVTTILGPILPLLASQWSLSDAKAGSLFTAQFLGALFGGLFTSVMIPRRGYRFVLAVGFLGMAAGIGCLGFSRWPSGWFATLIYGTGLGFVLPSTNLYVSEAMPRPRAASLSILNLSWGIGAVACPLLVSLLEPCAGLPRLLTSLGILLALFALAFSLLKLATSPQQKLASDASHRRLRLGAHAWALAALFFLYVGAENALSGWVSTYAKRIGTPAQGLWVITPSVFWGGLLLGRALAPLLLRVLAETKLAAAGLLLASCGTLTVLLSTTLPGIRFGAGIAGLGLAPLFPIYIAWLGQEFGAEAQRLGGVMFGLASCGGATLPWLVGAVSTSFASLHSGLTVPLISCLLMLVALPAVGSTREDRRGRHVNRLKLRADTTEDLD